MRKPWRITATLLFTTAVLAGALVGDRVLALSDDARESMRLYTELLTIAHEEYGSEVAYRDLVFATVQGMLRTLDPHTSFLSPRAYTGMREKQKSTFYGLGILVSRRNGHLTVMTPMEGTPAFRLGMRAGDIISSIEGEPTSEMTLDEAIDRLKGPKGTEVSIEIVRRGIDEPIPMTVTRAEIPQTTVRYAYMLDDETGYIWLTDFNRATAQEVADAIKSLKDQGMTQLLFDLRNNGGGLLDQAIDVADQFVPSRSEIVETRGRTRDTLQAYESMGKYPTLGLPVVVLVNGATASAAEIVSGAIQDHDVGLVVGTPTWGKGLVQTVYTLSYGAGLALTTAKYYTPSGRLIQRDYTSYYDYVTAANQGDDPAPPDRSQVYRTDLGREVYGGGGITPDVLVDAGTLTELQQYLLARNAFLNFAVDYTLDNPVDSTDWRPGPEILERFRRWAVDEGVVDAEEVAELEAGSEESGYILRMINGEIFNTRFGQVEQQRVLAEGDVQIQKGLSLFDNATQLLAQRLERDAVAEAGATGAMR